MTITSFWFILFVFASLVIFHLIPQSKRWTVLLAVSVIFYMSFDVYGIIVLALTSLIAYLCGIKIQKLKDSHKAWLAENKKKVDKDTRKQKKQYYQKKERLFLAITVVIAVGALFLCKYYKVFSSGINRMLDVNIWTAENILLPLGISYYTLQLIGYVIDVYRDIIPAERNPLKVMLYGCFFLSIMQGPFNRYNHLMPQICSGGKKLTYAGVKLSVIRITCGYIKKLCIADQAGLIVSNVFTSDLQYTGLANLLGIICFAVQLYADFSGYMDIIVGIGQLFGIEMPENFRQPFFSESITEFWQRWHISLGLWLKDYVFYPVLKSKQFARLNSALGKRLSKNASRDITTYLGMLILWTLIGLWHGAGLNYVFSVGLLQFIYIFVGEVTKPLMKKLKGALRINDAKMYWRVFRMVRTTALMCFAWVFFNTKTIAEGLRFVRYTAVLPSLDQLTDLQAGAGFGNIYIRMAYILVCCAALLFADIMHERNVCIGSTIMKKNYAVRLAFYLLLCFTLIIFGAYGSQYVASNFIYFEF